MEKKLLSFLKPKKCGTMERCHRAPDKVISILNINGYTFRGNNSAVILFTSLFNGDQLLMENHLSLQKQILSNRVGFILEGLCGPEKQTGISQLFPFVKIAGKTWRKIPCATSF